MTSKYVSPSMWCLLGAMPVISSLTPTRVKVLIYSSYLLTCRLVDVFGVLESKLFLEQEHRNGNIFIQILEFEWDLVIKAKCKWDVERKRISPFSKLLYSQQTNEMKLLLISLAIFAVIALINADGKIGFGYGCLGINYDWNSIAVPVCDRPKFGGPCRAYFPRFYFNTAKGQCERFIYGGCGSNGNNFDSKDDCETFCLTANILAAYVNEATATDLADPSKNSTEIE